MRIEDKANSIIEGKFNSPPIKLTKIASECGIQIIKEDLPVDVSGILYLENPRKAKIFINKSDTFYRQRFTVAHELGHYILHNFEGTHIDKFDTKRKIKFRKDQYSNTELLMQEVEANKFAANLLMPENMLLGSIETLLEKSNQSRSAADFIKKLSDIFEVSPEAMKFRLINIGVIESSLDENSDNVDRKNINAL